MVLLVLPFHLMVTIIVFCFASFIFPFSILSNSLFFIYSREISCVCWGIYIYLGLADLNVANKAQSKLILYGHLICILLVRFKIHFNRWEEALEVLDNYIP